MIHQIHKRLQVDERWTQWHDDGFTWWSERLAQRIRFEGPFDAYGIYIGYLSFDTDFLRAHVGSEEYLKAVAAELTAAPGLFTAAVVGRQLKLRGRHYVLRADDEITAMIVADYARWTNSIAHRLAFSERQWWRTGAEPDVSDHLSGSRREEPDERMVAHWVLDPGPNLHPSPQITPNIDRMVTHLASAGYPEVEVRTAGSLTASIGASGRRISAVVTVDLDHESALLGIGTRFSTMIAPAMGDAEIESSWADHLNEITWETRRSPTGLGTWVPGPGGTLTHVLFYPGQFPSNDVCEAVTRQLEKIVGFACLWLRRV